LYSLLSDLSQSTDGHGQIADHYAWATFRASESQDDSWLRKLPGPHRIRWLK